MPSDRVARPRTLSIVFGVYFLLMAVIAWYSGSTLGYHYAADLTRWAFTVYLLVGAVFLVGIGLGALRTVRYLDARIERLESSSDGGEVVQELVAEEPVSDEVPPPLQEDPAPSGDHVDRDIDELLVSLQEMEQDATAPEEAEVTEAAPAAASPAEKPVSSLLDSKQLAALRKKRDHIGAFFMLPGSDQFLQYNWQLNTSLLLGLGYTFAGVAAYVVASMLLVTRNR